MRIPSLGPIILLLGACSNGTTTATDAGGALDASSQTADATTPDSGPADAGQPSCSLAGSDAERYHTLIACLRAGTLLGAERASVISDFMTTIERSGGFPIATSSASIAFVYYRTEVFDPALLPTNRQAPIRLSGDFNGWSTSANPLEQLGEDFFHLERPIDPALAQPAYRLVAVNSTGDVSFADPMTRRFSYDDLGRKALIRGSTTSGHLEWLRSVHATMLDVDRPIYLYLPPGYDQGSARYPVLYMHDGQNLFDNRIPGSAVVSWEVDQIAEREIHAGHIQPMIIVGISNNDNRDNEYTQTTDALNGGTEGGQADAYGDFVVHELKPLIDQMWRTRPERGSTAMLGSSFGGLVSYYLGFRYPEVFRYVGGMSTTFGWGQYGLMHTTVTQLYQGAADLPARDQVYYLDSGGGPPANMPCGMYSTSADQDWYCDSLGMVATLRSNGITVVPDNPDALPLTPPNINLFYWWDPQAPHNESSWHRRVHRPLRLFFR